MASNQGWQKLPELAWLLLCGLLATDLVYALQLQIQGTKLYTAGLYKAFTFKWQRPYLKKPKNKPLHLSSFKPSSQLPLFHLFNQLLSLHFKKKNLNFKPDDIAVWGRQCCLIRLKDTDSHPPPPSLFMRAYRLDSEAICYER